MAEVVSITLTAKDGTQSVWKAAGNAAQKMGDQVESAGKRGSKSLKDWEDRGRAAGLALGALGAIAVRAANESEAVGLRLQQSIENAGGSIDALQPRIDALSNTALTLAFDDEDALGALANLVDATGDAKVALDDMALVMDIARARGIGLAESAKIVAAVEQGRYASLVRLGIQIDDNATRESALGELQAKYAGQAATYADTNAASWDRMGNTIENRLEGIGSHLADIQGPLIALGAASQLGLGGLATSLFGGGGAIAGVTGLAAAAAPLVVTMAALAAPIGIATYLIADQDNVMRRAAEATAVNNAQLQEYIGWLNQVATADVDPIEFQGTNADQMLDFFRDVNQEVLLTRDGISGVTVPMSDLRDNINSLDPANFQTLLNVAEDFGILWNDPSTWTTENLNILADNIVHLTRVEQDAAFTEMNAQQTRARSIVVMDEQVEAVDRLNRAEQRQADDSQRRMDANRAALDREKGNDRGREQDRYVDDRPEEFGFTPGEVGSVDGMTGAVLNLTEAQQGGINARQIEIATTERLTATREDAAAAAEAEAQAVLAATQSYAGMVGTTQALDAGISVVIGGLDNLGAGVEKVDGSLRGLVGAAGEWSTLDDLVHANKITWDQYDAAVKAADDTTANNATTQQDLNAILTNQAPLLADLAWQQQQYVAGLADQSAEEQLLALAYMDSAESAKALELQTLALSAANGELGEGGKGFAKDVIRGAAEADPILKAMLEDMGLISVGAEGTIKVNFGEGTSELEALNTTLQQLQGAFEVSLNVDLNDDGIIGYVPPEKEMKVKPVVEEGADAPTFDPITWPVDLKINENAPPTFDPIKVDIEPTWPQYTIEPVAPDPIKVAYEYEVADAPAPPTPEPIVWPVNLKVNEAAAPELPDATATVSLDTTAFDTAYGTVTTNVATLDALTASVSVSIASAVAGKVQEITNDVATIDALAASVSVSISSAVGGKVQDIVNDVGTIDALTATIDIDGDSAGWFDASNAVATSVGSVDAWSATVEIGGDGQPFWDVMANVQVSKDQVDGWNPVIDIGGNGTPFWDVMNNVQISQAQVDGWNPIIDIGADTSLYYGAVGGVSLSVATVDGWSATVDIGANTAPYYANLPVTGQTIGTNYVDIQTRQLGGQGGAFATGGLVTARMGEVGPEAITIPGSAMRAIAPRDGLYNVPEGSYVSPAVATRGMGGGGSGGADLRGATIFVIAPTPDIHDALNGQLLAQGRR